MEPRELSQYFFRYMRRKGAKERASASPGERTDIAMKACKASGRFEEEGEAQKNIKRMSYAGLYGVKCARLQVGRCFSRMKV